MSSTFPLLPLIFCFSFSEEALFPLFFFLSPFPFSFVFSFFSLPILRIKMSLSLCLNYKWGNFPSGKRLSVVQTFHKDMLFGGGNFCSSGSLWGRGRGNRSNSKLTFEPWSVATFLCGKGGDDQERRAGEEEHVRGQGEDDTPEGWTFLNIYSFVRTELAPFWQKVKVKFSQKLSFVC